MYGHLALPTPRCRREVGYKAAVRFGKQDGVEILHSTVALPLCCVVLLCSDRFILL